MLNVHAGESFISTVIRGQVQARQSAEKKPEDSELVHKPLWASTFSLVSFLVGILWADGLGRSLLFPKSS